jgi:hypothetical protein
MKRRDPTVEALDALSELRHQPASEPLARRLRSFLGNKSNLVIAKAAKTAGDLRVTELTADLAAAFHRLMANPAKLDKSCAAVTAIAGALYSMDYESPDVYLKGVRHVQLEASFGPPVDAAAQLRSDCALGLVRTRHPDALFDVVRLLVDKEPRVRTGAARALGTVVGEAAELLLSLKVLTGDAEPDVLAECFSGLLATGAGRSLTFVASYLDHADEAIAEAAILALGASRLLGAIDALREKWDRTVRSPTRKTLLLALATARQDSALEFLLSLVAAADSRVALDVIGALRMYRNDDRVRQSLEEAVRQRGDRRLTDAFHAEFQS